MRRLAFLLLFTAVAVAADEPERLVCMGRADRAITLEPPDCVIIKAPFMRIEAADTLRPLILLDPERGTLLVDLERSASKIDLNPNLSRVSAALRSTGDHPPELTVTIRSDRGNVWRWIVGWKETATLRFSAPPGRYRAEIDATDHERLEIPWFEVTNQPRSMGTLIMKAVPRLRGRILDSESKSPVPATLTVNDTVIGMAEMTGYFDVAIRGDWPEWITIIAPGYGSKTVEVAKSASSLDLGVFELSRGGTIHLTVSGDENVRSARATLIFPSRKPRTIGHRQISPERGEAVFENLEPRRYSLQLSGPGPLQRFGKRVLVEAGATQRLNWSVAQKRLHLAIYLGDRRLPESTIALHHVEGDWHATVTTDRDGEVEVDLWQPGEFVVSVTSPEVAVPFLEVMKIGDRESEVIRLPDARISGRVIEAATAKPIAGAEIALQTQSASSTTSLRAESDAAGRFEFRSVKPGRHTLGATAEGFIASVPLEFELTSADSLREVTVNLVKGVVREIAVIDIFGRPVASAALAEIASGQFIGLKNTDASGTTSLTIPEGERRTIVVIPANGSFAVARLEPVRSKRAEPLQVVIPEPSAALEVTTRTTNGDPVPNVALLFRYNREALPFEVIQLLDRVQSTRFISDAAGRLRLPRVPPGFYEFQPVWSAKESQRSGSPRAEVEVRPGENVAILTFAPAERP